MSNTPFDRQHVVSSFSLIHPVKPTICKKEEKCFCVDNTMQSLCALMRYYQYFRYSFNSHIAREKKSIKFDTNTYIRNACMKFDLIFFTSQIIASYPISLIKSLLGIFFFFFIKINSFIGLIME